MLPCAPSNPFLPFFAQAPWRSGKMPAFESAPLIQKTLSTVSECSCRAPRPAHAHRLRCAPSRAGRALHPCTVFCTSAPRPCTLHRAPCTVHRAGRVKQGSMTNEDVLRSEIPWPSFQNAGIISKEQLEMMYLLDKQAGSS